MQLKMLLKNTILMKNLPRPVLSVPDSLQAMQNQQNVPHAQNISTRVAFHPIPQHVQHLLYPWQWVSVHNHSCQAALSLHFQHLVHQQLSPPVIQQSDREQAVPMIIIL